MRPTPADIADLERRGAVVGPAVLKRCKQCNGAGYYDHCGYGNVSCRVCRGTGDAEPKVVPCAWTMAIGGWHPAPLNTLLGHHMQRSKLKAHDRDIIARAVLVYGVPRATGKRRVSLHLVLEPKQRAADPDAFWKALLDGLVQSVALKDDNRQWVELGPVTFSRGDAKGCFVTLEDVP